MDHNPEFLAKAFDIIGAVLGLSSPFAAFLMLQSATILIAVVFKKVRSAGIRKLSSLSVGLLWCYILYGLPNTMFLLGISAIFYVVPVFKVLPASATMLLGVALLSVFHIYRMWESYMSWSLDVTGPLMLLTAKFTSFAYDVADGRKSLKNVHLSPTEHIAEARQRSCLTSIPSVYEYYVFLFDFLGILAGPIYHIREYLDFIYLRNDFAGLGHVSFQRVVAERLSYVALIGASFTAAGMIPQLQFDYVNSLPFLEAPWLVKLILVNFITAANRLRYYFAWYMSDVACLVAGIGYNPSHRDRFSRGQNAIISKVDLANCQSEAMSYWNISISKWLRENVYLRALEAPVPSILKGLVGHRQYATLLTRFVSAFWHGFYPGYYLCFFSTVLQFEADTIARKYIRPMFTAKDATKPHWIYTLGGKVHTALCLNYYGSAFLVLSVSAAINIWMHLFFAVHIFNLLTIVLVPVFFKRGRVGSVSKEL